MGMFFLLSLLGMGMLASFSDGDDSQAEDAQDQELDSTDLLAPLPPPLGDSAFEITEAVGAVDDSERTEGGAYYVTDNYYDITTGSGDDTVDIQGDTSGDAYLGGVAFLGGGDDAAWGDDGRDVMRGEGGNDSLYGGDGNDSLIDTEGENSIYGGAGDDFIRASDGSTIVGGDGADTIDLYLSTSAESPLRFLDFDPDTDQFRSVRLYVSDGDTYDVSAVAREDGDGADLMFGDRVLAEVFGASVDDLIDLPVDIVVQGGTYTDDDSGRTISGNYSLPETISGAGGDDTIRAGTGDLIDAGDGNDSIYAYGQLTQDVSNPSDMSTVQAGSGDDIIISTNGNVLTGGDGADIFSLRLSQYSGGRTGSGFDLTESIITDFDPAQDVIYIATPFFEQAGGTIDAPEETLSIQVWPNGEGADILAGDEVIARVNGAQTLRVEDLVTFGGGLDDILGSQHT